MKDYIYKIGIIVIALLLPVNGTILNSCLLKYQNDVQDKPDLIVVTSQIPSICRIRSNDNSSVLNYHWQNISLATKNRRLSFGTYRNIYGTPRNEEYHLGIVSLNAHDALKMIEVRGINYDSRTEEIFYMSNKLVQSMYGKLNKLRLDDRKSSVILDQQHLISDRGPHPPIDTAITDLAYDWVTKNIYMNARKCILVINAYNQQNFTEVASNRTNILSLAVHPNEGYLFFIDKQRPDGLESYAIYRAYLDGSNVNKIIQTEGDQMFIVSLVIDFYSDRLYWYIPDKEIIQNSNLDGTDVKTITGRKVYFGLLNESSRSLAIDRDYVYYRPKKSNSVRRFRKSDQVEDEDFRVTNRDLVNIIEVMIYSSETQKIREDHPCRYSNGGCDEFCFAVPKNNRLSRICGCSNGKTLTRNVVCEDDV